MMRIKSSLEGSKWGQWFVILTASLLVAVALMGIAACSRIEVTTPMEITATSKSLPDPSPKPTGAYTSTPFPTQTIQDPVSSPQETNTPTATTLIATLSPTKLFITPTATPCSAALCTYTGHFLLERPIAPSGRDTVDPTYRYGSTQGGLRETHHGVEFVNSQGTPVLAAADGVVVVAGDDHSAVYADWPYYYGNLVILQHNFPELDQPLFTLYGHLFEVIAQPGQEVIAGETIGLVGFTGTAIGSHLHFEVRLGENSYDHTRNPELWLRPHEDEDGQPHGAIIGRVVDEFGNPIYIPSVVIEPLDEAGNSGRIYLETYADQTVNPDDLWGENFAVGNLAPGLYRLTFVARGIQSYEVEVLPGQVTRVTFDAREEP
jgi:murein DD-endopeptidase MepM/ murein hydrolase activator NlpD